VAREGTLNPSTLDVGQSLRKSTVDYTSLRGGALIGSGREPRRNVDHAAGNAGLYPVSVPDVSLAAHAGRHNQTGFVVGDNDHDYSVPLSRQFALQFNAFGYCGCEAAAIAIRPLS
jgi:hypothetical protein